VRTALELAEMHLRTLYVIDDHGRILRETVDKGDRLPPRFMIVRTAEGFVSVIRHDVDDEVALVEVERFHLGLAYAFPSPAEPDPEVIESEPGTYVLSVDGRVVSSCATVRDVGDAVQAGVETVEGYRGRGYAPRVVATWVRAMQRRGVEPIYSTSRENTASQSVARKAGGVLIATDVQIF
jgi:RimJ/RimL family protein N-acetyltransferase